MTPQFRVLSTPAFERELRVLAKGNSQILSAYAEILTALRDDPYNRTRRHKIKKLVQVNPDDGQWRIRWRDYRLRYDILGGEVVLHSFRHRKESY